MGHFAFSWSFFFLKRKFWRTNNVETRHLSCFPLWKQLHRTYLSAINIFFQNLHAGITGSEWQRKPCIFKLQMTATVLKLKIRWTSSIFFPPIPKLCISRIVAFHSAGFTLIFYASMMCMDMFDHWAYASHLCSLGDDIAFRYCKSQVKKKKHWAEFKVVQLFKKKNMSLDLPFFSIHSLLYEHPLILWKCALYSRSWSSWAWVRWKCTRIGAAVLHKVCSENLIILVKATHTCGQIQLIHIN